MAIKQEYSEYLDHFGKTTTLLDMWSSPGDQDVVGLRHDIDYDLNLALEMAYWEKERGCRATYYVLHTAPYWKDSELIEKCLQIQDFGHEIGIHLNVLTEWAAGKANDIEAHLASIIEPFRDAGIKVGGVSPHGDTMCYEQQYINYWCFAELRPDDPIKTESGLSAEGIPVDDEKYQIKYPSAHTIKGSDGRVMDLWAVSMERLGLKYDAIHIPIDKYYTDSGGKWTRSADPMGEDMTKGRLQVLVHPVHWKGEQKLYFFLSTARSGSKWLASYLDGATSVNARHEFALNHKYEGDRLVEEKRTGKGFAELLKQQNEIEDLLRQLRVWVEQLGGDYAEANVYLAHIMPLVKKIFPDAVLVHLKRAPEDVIRSIINRDWYDTPEDNQHPEMPLESWSEMSQFEKACWYVKKTNEEIRRHTTDELAFENMVNDYEYMVSKMKAIGIATYPRFALSRHKEVINRNYNYEFPEYRKWPIRYKRMFHRIMGSFSVWRRLMHCIVVPLSCLADLLALRRRMGDIPSFHCSQDFRDKHPEDSRASNCALEKTEDGWLVSPKQHSNAYVTLFGGKWNELPNGRGIDVQLGCYYHGSLSAEVGPGDGARLFVLFYGRDGDLKYKRSLGTLAPGDEELIYSFRPRPDIYRMDLALYISGSGRMSDIILQELKLESVKLSREQL